MRIVSSEEQEEWLAVVLLDETDRARREDVGHVLVFPQRGLAAGHVPDTADAVHDRLVVTVAGFDPQQSGIGLAGGTVVHRRVVADADRILGIESDHATVLDVDGGHAIAGRRHDERVVEADLARTGCNRRRSSPVHPPGQARDATCRRRRSHNQRLRRSSQASVRWGSMTRPASPGSTFVPGLRHAYWPVSRA